jgi:hypothetical protein
VGTEPSAELEAGAGGGVSNRPSPPSFEDLRGVCMSQEAEKIEHPAEPVRVTVTPEWLAENAKKQRRYKKRREKWLVFIGEKKKAE